MAQEERRAEERRDAKKQAKTRGQARGKRAGANEPFAMYATHWVLLAAFGHVALAHGGAVRVGLTRDQGALALGVYAGDEYGTEYIRPTEDFAEALREIAEAWFTYGDLDFDKAVDGLVFELQAAKGDSERPPKKA